MRHPSSRVTTLALRVIVILVALAGPVWAFVPAVSAAPAAAPSAEAAHFSKQLRLGFKSGDDWEPALAADRYGHLYALFKHYDVAGGGTCAHCNLHVVVQRSDDNGRTWGDPRAIAPIPVKGGQYDSQIAVDPVDGKTVWASFLENAHSVIDVVKSTDFGETWSAPVTVSHESRALDKDELAVRGPTVAVAYDDNFNTLASISYDGGRTWTEHLITHGSAAYNLPLAAGGGIDSRGDIFFSWDSFDKSHSKNGDGPVTLWVTKSADGGAHWTRTFIDVSGAPPPCDNCGFAFLSAQMALRVGGDDTIYLLWNGTTSPGANFAPERIFFARSSDHGASYSRRQDVSLAARGVEHCFPALVAGARPGDVRIAWADKRTGAWNVFLRASVNHGSTWSGESEVSGFVGGYSYLTPSGFGLPYGDYFQLAIDDEGETQVAWGEAASYAGPGNIWTAHSSAA